MVYAVGVLSEDGETVWRLVLLEYCVEVTGSNGEKVLHGDDGTMGTVGSERRSKPT